MFDKAFELGTKALLGEHLTDEEKSYLRNRDIKYKLVRFLYMEKANSKNGPQTINFQFTPGDSFDDTPTIDIVNSLLKVTSKMKGANKQSNPPHTGMVKKSILDS